MDRAGLSSALIQEMQAVVGEALAAVVPEMGTMDLATLEQRAQPVGRVLLGRLIERVAAGHAQLLPHSVRGAACGGQLKRGRSARATSWAWRATTRCTAPTSGVHPCTLWTERRAPG
jgi:hypothetical protein